MASYVERLIGAARLDPRTYEEVEADSSAMGQAMATVLLSSLAAGVGSIREGGIGGLVIIALSALIGWFVWALLTWFIGTRLLPEPQTESDLGELLRTIGFSASPGLLRVLAVVPAAGPLLALIASVWMLVAMVVAVRQALDYQSTGRAVGVCLIGFVIYLVALLGMTVVFSAGAAVFGSTTP